jgi:multiple sugar transport system substrate-binding protein
MEVRFVKSFKKLSTVLVSLTMLFMTACGSNSTATKEGGSSSASNATNGQVKTVKVWSRDNVAALLKNPVDTFNQNHKDIKIELTSIPANNFSEQFSAALASNNVPDVVTLDLVYAPYYSSLGAFKDITSQFNSLDFKDKLNPNMVKLGNYNGKQYAIPLSADVSALIYNKAHFKEAGLDPEKPPVTWKELQEDAKKLTTKDHYGYVYGAAAPGTLMFTFLPYLWGNGGNLTSDDGKKALLDQKESIEGLKLLTDMTVKDKVVPPGSPTYQGQQAYDAFTSGKASMIVYGNFKVSDLNMHFKDLDYGVALIPKNEGKEHSSFIGGDVIAITASSKYDKEAMEFINYALSKDVQVDYLAKNGTIPVRSDFFDNEYFKKEPKYKVFTDALKVGKTPYSVKHNEILKAFTETQQALNGSKSPDEVFTNESKEIQKLLESK